jgi:hypothetical protein
LKEEVKVIKRSNSPAMETEGSGRKLKRGGWRREFRGSWLGPSGDGALMVFQRLGGAADV